MSELKIDLMYNELILDLPAYKREKFLKKFIFDCNFKMFYPLVVDIKWVGKNVTAKIIPTGKNICFNLSNKSLDFISYGKTREQQTEFFLMHLIRFNPEPFLDYINIGRQTKDYKSVYYTIDKERIKNDTSKI